MLTEEQIANLYYTSGYGSTEYDGGALQFARAIEQAVRDEAIMHMALCETHSLVLRPGQLYTFNRVGDCEKCAALEASAIEAYGEDFQKHPGQHAIDAARGQT